jgi:hypothetical protein
MVNYTLNGVFYSVDNGAVVVCFGVFFGVVVLYMIFSMWMRTRIERSEDCLVYPKRESVERGKGEVVVTYEVPVDGVVSKAITCLSGRGMCPYCNHIWKSKRKFLQQCPKCKHRLK